MNETTNNTVSILMTDTGNQLHPRLPGSHKPVAKASITVASGILFNGARELVIEHSGERYLLRLTKQDKLILTK